MRTIKNYILIFTLLATVACNNDVKKSPSQSDEKILVKVEEIKSKPTSGSSTQYNYSGSLEAYQHVSLSFISAGKVANISAEVGQTVKKGQLLAYLDSRDYQNQVAISEANLLLAKDNYERIARLFKKQSIPESQFIGAKAKLQSAEAQLKIHQKQLEDTRLTAPFDAVVSKRNIELGMLVSSSVPAFELVELKRMYAVIAVPEHEITTIKQNERTRIHIESVKEEFEGVVEIISPVSDPISRTFEVKVRLKNPGNLKVGMLAEINYHVTNNENYSSVVIPGNALLNSPELGDYVYVIDQALVAHTIPVKVSAVKENEVIISQGLVGGERLVVAGQHKLTNGTPIRI